jgi:hypothetical protein
VSKRIDADRAKAIQIKFLGIPGRRFQDDLVLIVMLGSVRIFAIAAVCRPPGRLDIRGFPRLGTEGPKECIRRKSAGADFKVIRLHHKTALASPVVV